MKMPTILQSPIQSLILVAGLLSTMIRPCFLRRSAALTILAGIFSACAAVLASDETPIVNIPDPTLAHAIRLALKKPVGEITLAEMESLEILDGSRLTLGRSEIWPAITNLTGLEAAKNLRSLDLMGGIVWGTGKIVYPYDDPTTPTPPPDPDPGLLATSDFSPLDGLTKLEDLNLSRNYLTSVTLPSNLPGLRWLNLMGNSLTNLAIPASIDLGQLEIVGFPKDKIDVLGFWISQFTVSADRSSISFRGVPGSRVQVQRTTDFRNWQTLETALINQYGNSTYSVTRNGPREFFRVIAAE